MQITLDKNDRRLLQITIAVIVVLIVVLAVFSREDDKDSGVPTSYSAQSSGAKAAYLLLKEEGYNVERWESSLSELPDEAAKTVLVLAGPIRGADKEEKDAVRLFLNRPRFMIICPAGETSKSSVNIRSPRRRGGSGKFCSGSDWKDASGPK